MLREFVTSTVMKPIRQMIELEYAQAMKGKELNEEERMRIQQQVEEETKARPPEEVRKYMAREHQDPVEVLCHQIQEYLFQKEAIASKFNKGMKHLCISGEEIFWVGAINGEPALKVVNPLFFDYDKSPDLDSVEDGEWAVCEYRMTPSAVIAQFGSQLTDSQIDDVYQYMHNNHSGLYDADFAFNELAIDEPYTISVKHCTWKALKKMGFLNYIDANGTQQMMVVDENYKLDKDHMDISIEWEWIPEVHETYWILDDIFVYCRPVLGQYLDLDNLYNSKLPYFGAAIDNLNSPTTAPMDRMKQYQYFYDIIIYRIELLMASDKGKILGMNINAVPTSAGITMDKFIYFMEANHIAWLNPNEEGNRSGTDVTNMVKEIDMSLITNIKNYIDLAEYIENKCGNAIGVTKAMEAQVGPNEAVSKSRQNLVQASHIVQPIFELHNEIKRNVLQALIDMAVVVYSQSKPKKLSYFLDDMSMQLLDINGVNQNLLDNASYGIFVTNSSKAADAKNAIESLAQAALQNQQADLSDIIKIIRSDSVPEAEEMLEASKQRNLEEQQKAEQQKIQAAKEAAQIAAAEREAQRTHEKEMIILKEEERRKTEIQKQTIFSLGFDPNKDQDQDRIPDVLEVAKFGVDADIRGKELQLEQDKLQHQKKVDEEKLRLEDKKIKAAQQKNKSK